MIARILLLFTFLLPAAAEAQTTWYYSRCDTGAHPSCVPGNDANDGLSPSTPKLTAPTSTQFNAAACGDQFLFAQGGRWDGYVAGQISHGQNCSSNPVIIGDWYAPPSGATGRPRLHNTTASADAMFAFGSYNNTTDDRGYIIRNLELSSDACASTNCYTREYAFRMFGRLSYVTLDNLYIHNFRYAVQVYPNDTISVPTIDHITIKNSTIESNYSMGFLAIANDFLVQGNTFVGNNFTGSGFNHGFYISATGWTASRVTVRGNTFTNNSRNLIGAPSSTDCTGGNLTGHGIINGLVVEDNTITQVSSDGGCYGISLTDSQADNSFLNTIVRRNTVVNMGECGICFNILSGGLIENNVIVNDEPYPSQHVCIFTTPDNGVTQNPNSNVIRNNSCYHANGDNAYGPNTVNLDAGTGNIVANNLTVFGSSVGAKYCYYQEAIGAYSFYDYNWCYSAGGGTLSWSPTITTLANAQAAGYDANSVMGTDPLLAAVPSAGNGYSMQLQSGSPVIGAGTNTHCARTTKDGKLRSGTCTPGAFQPGL